MRAYNASNNVASNRDSARQSAKGKLRKMGQYNSDVLNKNTERQRLKSQPSNLVTSQGAAALRALNARRSEAAQKRSCYCKGLNSVHRAWWIILRVENKLWGKTLLVRALPRGADLYRGMWDAGAQRRV